MSNVPVYKIIDGKVYFEAHELVLGLSVALALAAIADPSNPKIEGGVAIVSSIDDFAKEIKLKNGI